MLLVVVVVVGGGAMPLRTTALPISLSLTSERQTAQSGPLLKGRLRIEGRLMESNGALTRAEALSHFLAPSHGFLNATPSFYLPPPLLTCRQ